MDFRKNSSAHYDAEGKCTSFSILAKTPHHLGPVCYYVNKTTAYSKVIPFDEDGRNDFLSAHKCEGRR
jgi:hypothetical protein